MAGGDHFKAATLQNPNNAFARPCPVRIQVEKS
jgi:hypothetical protein